MKGRQLLLGLTYIILFISILSLSLYSVFFANTSSSATAEMNDDEMLMTYQTFSVYKQDPVSLEGIVEIKNDRSYFYDPEQGEIKEILVKEGQKVGKGQVLFNYYNEGRQEELEDALREQTRLYNQREALISDLSQQTQQIYNYQGDLVLGYWGEDGQKYYYVAEPIGKGQASGIPIEEASASEVPGDSTVDVSSYKEQIRDLNQQIEDIEIKLIRIRKNQNAQVTAKHAGTVLLNRDALENPQIPLIRVLGEELLVTGSVDEYNFHALAEDRRVELYVNAEDRYVEGIMTEYDKVPPISSSINTEGSTVGSPSNGTQYGFAIQPQEAIQPGFSVKIQVPMPGVVVPKDAIVEESGQSFVFVYQEGKAIKTLVDLERQGTQRVNHRQLQEGDILLLYPYDLEDAQEVQTDMDMMGLEDIGP